MTAPMGRRASRPGGGSDPGPWIEPGPDLRDLHQRILSADPALAVPGRPPASEPARAVPRELPPAVPGFTGRSAELRAPSRSSTRR
jgi:hypothetical protein